MCKENKSIVYLYRMTHDYGNNPCCFNESIEPTPELLTLGGCKKRIQGTIYRNYRDLLENNGIDIYIMAIAGEPRDHGREDKNGIGLITSNYEALMYVAKISSAMTRDEYWQNPKYSDRKDAIWYREHEKEEPLPVLLSDNFVYYGKNAKAIDQKIIDLFPPRQGHRTYDGSDKKKEQTALLLSFIKNELNGEGSVMGEPYNPNPKF